MEDAVLNLRPSAVNRKGLVFNVNFQGDFSSGGDGNGHDLRNKYIHGTHSLKSEVHKRDYIELLKIMVLIIIKINQEFCLREKNKEATHP